MDCGIGESMDASSSVDVVYAYRKLRMQHLFRISARTNSDAMRSSLLLAVPLPMAPAPLPLSRMPSNVVDFPLMLLALSHAQTDPGVPIVFAGFGCLMLTTCISFSSHSQIWAFQDGTTVVVGGKTNRAKGEFPEEMNYLLDQVPEIVDSSASKQPKSISG